MTSGTITSSLKQLCDLFDGGTAVGLGDGELLRRFAANRDAAAFAALLARHGPMVAATCRAVLRDPHDAEDAFQATFLVLARRADSIRGGDALGGWLHRVAHRAAVQRSAEIRRRRRHESEAPAMGVPAKHDSGLDFDERSILHEEVDRLPELERLAVVLCDLEGRTYEQAAGQLGWTAPSLYHRLAAGRKRLRNRLIRRGIMAAAAGVAVDASRGSAAAVPVAWTDAALAAATGGPVPQTVAALAHTIIRTSLVTRVRLAASAILAMATIISVGLVAARAGRPEMPKHPIAAPIADEPRPGVTESDGKVALTVAARDLATGADLPGVHVTLQRYGSNEQPSATTDQMGMARFSIPADCRLFVLRAGREDRVPLFIQWVRTGNESSLPDRVVFQMEKATAIRGRVVDQDSKPLAGATVVIDVKKDYPGSPQRVNLMFRSTVADADGRWSFSCVPEHPESIQVTAYHDLCRTESTCFLPVEYNPASALRDGSATLGLRRGTVVEVTVVGPDGRPVPESEVIVGNERRYGNSIPSVKADARGRLTLGFKPGIATTLIARHTGFGPAMQALRVGSEPQRITLRPPSGQKMNVRVVGLDGKPLPAPRSACARGAAPRRSPTHSRPKATAASPGMTHPATRSGSRSLPRAIAEGTIWLCNRAGRLTSPSPHWSGSRSRAR